MKYIKSEEKDWTKATTYQKKILLTEKDIGSEGNLVQIVKIEAGQEVSSHYHKIQTEIFYIAKGQAVITIEKKDFLVKPGDTLVCQPNETHSVQEVAEGGIEILVFKINFLVDDSYWD